MEGQRSVSGMPPLPETNDDPFLAMQNGSTGAIPGAGSVSGSMGSTGGSRYNINSVPLLTPPIFARNPLDTMPPVGCGGGGVGGGGLPTTEESSTDKTLAMYASFMVNDNWLDEQNVELFGSSELDNADFDLDEQDADLDRQIAEWEQEGEDSDNDDDHDWGKVWKVPWLWW